MDPASESDDDRKRPGVGVRSHAEAYVESVVDCVALLPAALEAYRAEGAVGEVLGHVADAESVCDRRRRELARTLASMPAGFTDEFAPGHLVWLFERIDAVANRTEEAVFLLDATRPPLAGVAELDALVAATREAAAALSEATVAYVDSLPAGDPAAPEAAIRRVATLEERCDGIRKRAIRDAFAGEALVAADALLVRETVRTLESITDAAEDAADTLAYLRLVGA
jgi:uncharacterized protein Yka (UPF0111/DUF47 family)